MAYGLTVMLNGTQKYLEKVNGRHTHRGMNSREIEWFRGYIKGIPGLSISDDTLKFIQERMFPLAEDIEFQPLFNSASQQVAQVHNCDKEFTVMDLKWKDITPGQVYPCRPNASKSPIQLLDMDKFCDNIEYLDFDAQDKADTIFLRNSYKDLKRLFQMSDLKVGPMLSDDNDVAMLTPNGIYLSYKSVRYVVFIIDLVNHLTPLCEDDDQRGNVRTLLTDYSYCVPYANDIRKDGRMVPDGGCFDSELKSVMKDAFTSLFSVTLKRDWQESIPPLKRTKAPGFFCDFPDGTPYNKEDFSFTAESLSVAGRKTPTARYDLSPLKKAWVKTGGVLRNFLIFLNGIRLSKKPSKLRQQMLLSRFKHCCLSVHKRAFRTNNPDTPIIDIGEGGITADGLLHIHKKNRIIGFEVEDYKYFSGEVRDEDWEMQYRSLDYNRVFTALRKRPMFPGPNATFSMPFIFVFRRLLGLLEDSQCGFPCNRPENLAYLRQILDVGPDEDLFYLTFDRSNSEQFITDNMDEILACLPDWLADLLSDLLLSVLPSTEGARVSNGCCLSGTAATTLINFVCGWIEWVRITALTFNESYATMAQLSSESFCTACKLILDGDHITKVAPLHLHNNIRITCSAGTDDQVIGVVCPKALSAAIKQRFNDALKGRFLSGEASQSATVFGLTFAQLSIDVSQTLGLAKLFFVEHEHLGDAIALKMRARLQLTGKFYETIAERFIAHGFGDVSLYAAGESNFMDQLAKTGYPVSELYNVHSPSEKLIYGSYLETLGYNPVTHVERYEEQDLKPINEAFEKFLRSYSNG